MTDTEEKRTRVFLTQRDISALRWIGEQYAARLDQMQRVLAAQAGPGIQTPGRLSMSATRVWLTRMRQIGAVEYQLLFYGEPGYLWLTPYGLQIAGLDFKPLTPKPSTLHHLYWCNQARLYIMGRRPADVWRSERYLRQEHSQAGKRTSHRAADVPDALVRSSDREIAVEVELTDKQKARLAALVRVRAMTYHTTWYFCSHETYSLIQQARDQLEKEAQHIVIYALDVLKEQEER